MRELFSLGPISISPFGVAMMLAFLAAGAQLAWGLKKTGLGDADEATTILLWGALPGVLGAKVYYAILYQDWQLLFARYGFVWYGGLLVGTAGVIWSIRRLDLPAWRAADVAAPALALGYAIGRIGCFLVGDDYGVPSDLPWAVAFPEGLPPTRAAWLEAEFGVEIPPGVAPDALLTVHPTQLYETAAALVIWGLGCWLLARSARPGATVLAVLGLLACERFAVELFRAKDDRFFGALTLAQMISVALLVTVVWLALRRRPEWRRAAAEAPS